MALCISYGLPVTNGYPEGYSVSGLRNISGSVVTVRFAITESSVDNGVYSCPSGSYIAMTAAEIKSFTTAGTWTAQDGLTVGWSILAIWLGTAAIMFLGKIIKSGADNESDQS